MCAHGLTTPPKNFLLVVLRRAPSEGHVGGVVVAVLRALGVALLTRRPQPHAPEGQRLQGPPGRQWGRLALARSTVRGAALLGHRRRGGRRHTLRFRPARRAVPPPGQEAGRHASGHGGRLAKSEQVLGQCGKTGKPHLAFGRLRPCCEVGREAPGGRKALLTSASTDRLRRRRTMLGDVEVSVEVVSLAPSCTAAVEVAPAPRVTSPSRGSRAAPCRPRPWGTTDTTRNIVKGCSVERTTPLAQNVTHPATVGGGHNQLGGHVHPLARPLCAVICGRQGRKVKARGKEPRSLPASRVRVLPWRALLGAARGSGGRATSPSAEGNSLPRGVAKLALSTDSACLYPGWCWTAAATPAACWAMCPRWTAAPASCPRPRRRCRAGPEAPCARAASSGASAASGRAASAIRSRPLQRAAAAEERSANYGYTEKARLAGAGAGPRIGVRARHTFRRGRLGEGGGTGQGSPRPWQRP